MSTEEHDENEEFCKIVTKNLTSTRDTYEPLGDHIQRRHEVEVQTAQTLEVPEKKKRESGAQRRKRKRAEQIAEEGLRDTLCRWRSRQIVVGSRQKQIEYRIKDNIKHLQRNSMAVKKPYDKND
jgi:hypothetical protein